MQENEFSPEDSLQLIQSMIDKTKNSVADNSFYFLLWGWLVLAACIIQFVLKVIVQSPWHPLAWTLMIVGIIASALHGMNENKSRKVKTYIGELLDYLWLSIFLSFLLLGFIFARLGWQNCYSFYMVMYAIGSFVTGRALKFSPLVWGAIGSWFLAIVSTFTSYDINILLSGLAIILSYIIPGYLLKMKYRQMQVHV
ncbi:MAG TPA: hypothetical protein VMH01_03385 [Puia sp.]|nr:hypothetical protein [Puia sp.]